MKFLSWLSRPIVIWSARRARRAYIRKVLAEVRDRRERDAFESWVRYCERTRRRAMRFAA